MFLENQNFRHRWQINRIELKIVKYANQNTYYVIINMSTEVYVNNMST